MWVLLALSTAILYALQWVVIRWSHTRIPSSLVTVSHHIFAPFLAIGVLSTPMPIELAIVQIYLFYVFLVNPAFSWLSVHAAQRIPVSLSKPLSGFASISATFVGWLVFDTRFPTLGLLGIIMGIVGLWVLYHARWSAWKSPHPWILALCMINFGIVSVLTGQVLRVYPHPVIISGIGLIGALVVSCIGSIMHWKKWTITQSSLAVLLFISISHIAGEIILSTALGLAPAAYIVSIKRVSILLTAVIGYTFFREREIPLSRLIFATFLVTAGIIFMALT